MENVCKSSFASKGFEVINSIYSNSEIEEMISIIENSDTSNDTFRKSTDVFAIRQFVREIPEINSLLFNTKFLELLEEVVGKDYFLVKSIYFDKPVTSNWYVAYHQDLTISVKNKIEVDGFVSWTTKHNQFAVQPPIEFLENITTFRIHLDDTELENGALKVIDCSHLKGIYRPEDIDWGKEKETVCKVQKGGVMLMKPLTLHSSGRTTNQKRRRVIHLEFSNMELPHELEWSEKYEVFKTIKEL